MTTTVPYAPPTGDYILDRADVTIGFAVRAAVATVHGRFDSFDGRIHFDAEHPSRSSVEVTIAAGSIDTGNRRRDKDLRGRYLDARNHPVISFVSTGVEPVAESRFAVTGDLSIRGVSRPVTLAVDLTRTADHAAGDNRADDDRAAFTATATIDRRHWGVRWNAAVEGGGLIIGNKVRVEIRIARLVPA